MADYDRSNIIETYVRPVMLRKLKALAKFYGYPVAGILREAIIFYLGYHSKDLKKALEQSENPSQNS